MDSSADDESDLTTEIFGLPPCTDTTPVSELLDTLVACERWHSTLADESPQVLCRILVS